MRYSRLLRIYFKKHGEKTDNPSIKIYINKLEKGITFRIKRRCLIPETMKLFESSKSNITKDRNGENVSHLKIAITTTISTRSSISTL